MDGKWRYALITMALMTTAMFATGNTNAAPADIPQKLYDFCDYHDFSSGCSPIGHMVRGPDDALYGITTFGGSYRGGTVFRVDPSTLSVSTLYSFDPDTQGRSPDYLTMGSDGNLYGVLTNDFVWPLVPPSFFRLSLTGEYTPLYTLNGTFQDQPVEDSQGNWYGIALLNPVGPGSQVIYEIAADDTYKTLYAGFNGAVPDSLVLAQDGNLYGTTKLGGSYDQGTLFRLTPDGAYTELHSFSKSIDGAAYPAPNNLIVGSDGLLYGSTFADRSDTSTPAKAFNATLDGRVTFLHDLPGNGLNFTYPALTLMPDGYFYGAARNYAQAIATIFRLSPSGDVTYLFRFPYGALHDPSIPNPLVLGPDNALYGTTQGGGKYEGGGGAGILFRYVPPPVQ